MNIYWAFDLLLQILVDVIVVVMHFMEASFVAETRFDNTCGATVAIVITLHQIICNELYFKLK